MDPEDITREIIKRYKSRHSDFIHGATVKANDKTTYINIRGERSRYVKPLEEDKVILARINNRCSYERFNKYFAKNYMEARDESCFGFFKKYLPASKFVEEMKTINDKNPASDNPGTDLRLSRKQQSASKQQETAPLISPHQ